MPPAGLPPGHPPIAGMAPTDRHSGGPVDDTSIQPRTIVVEATGLPSQTLSSLEAKLFAWRRMQDEATVTHHASKQLDASGSARFDGVEQPSGVAYRVVVEYEGVPYASPTFRMHKTAGKRVPVRLFPLTSDIDRSRVGVQVILHIEPRDHHLQVEQLFRFANLSELTWRTGSLAVRLPHGATDIKTGEDPGPLKIHAVPRRGVLIEGVVPPGTVELAFQYELPYPDRSTAQLDLTLPPRVGAVRIMAAFGPELELRMAGAPPAVATKNEDGQRTLIVDRVVEPGGAQIETAHIVIDGLQTGGLARWIALLLTTIAVGAGFVIGFGRRRAQVSSKHGAALEREALLEQMAKLERSKRSGDISAERYEVEREVMLGRLTRLLEAESNANDS